MSWVSNILWGGLAVGAGYALLRYSSWMVYNIGRVPFAEKYLGSTHLFYKILGLIVIFFGFLQMTGMLGGFIMGTFGKLFGDSVVTN